LYRNRPALEIAHLTVGVEDLDANGIGRCYGIGPVVCPTSPYRQQNLLGLATVEQAVLYGSAVDVDGQISVRPAIVDDHDVIGAPLWRHNHVGPDACVVACGAATQSHGHKNQNQVPHCVPPVPLGTKYEKNH